MFEQLLDNAALALFAALWIFGLRLWFLRASWVADFEKWVNKKLKSRVAEDGQLAGIVSERAERIRFAIRFFLKPLFLCGYCMSSIHTAFWYVVWVQGGLLEADSLVLHVFQLCFAMLTTLVFVSRLFAMQRRGQF